MRLTAWELKTSTRLSRMRLDSIRSKILVFALLATLIPSLATAWVSYLQNKRALTDKLSQQLQGTSVQLAAEMDLWVKSHIEDLRVFSTSDEVFDNLERIGRGQGGAVRRLNDYLDNVRRRFSDYEQLIVVDQRAHPVTSRPEARRPTALPADLLTEIRADNSVVGEAAWDSTLGKAVMVLAVPIHGTGGRVIGALAAKLNFHAIEAALGQYTPAQGQVYLITTGGHPVIGSYVNTAEKMSHQLPAGTLQNLSEHTRQIVSYRGLDGTPVVGTQHKVVRVPWLVVAEVPTDAAYQQVSRLRNWTLLIVTLVLVVVGALAYALGLLIVRPLERLRAGAFKVASGDLSVDLPVISGGEVGYLTQVFNNMVARLRKNREELYAAAESLHRKNEELERLSITDGLTGLFNRRHVMKTLETEVRRVQRQKRPFAILMVDVDHFKKYNDSHGHQAGDEVLRRVGALLKDATRDVDCPARYGGEEFLILLTDTTLAGAADAAQRIRSNLAHEVFPGGPVTLSIGIAEFPEHGETVEAVIASADAALYRAKRDGRDRVVAATRRRTRESRAEA